MAVSRVPDAEGCIDFKCATDLSACQYHLVKLSAANTVAIADANGDAVVGILMNAPNGSTSGTNPNNTTAKVGCIPGYVYPCYAGAAVAAVYTALVPDGSGHAIGASDNDVVCAVNLTTAGASGDLMDVMWRTPDTVSNVSKLTDFS